LCRKAHHLHGACSGSHIAGVAGADQDEAGRVASGAGVAQQHADLRQQPEGRHGQGDQEFDFIHTDLQMKRPHAAGLGFLSG
jgi:hypothetical protein